MLSFQMLSSSAVENFLDREDVSGDFDIDSRQVTVRVSAVVPMKILGIIGLHWRTVSVTRSALLSDQ
jgi:hypothetical protein